MGIIQTLFFRLLLLVITVGLTQQAFATTYELRNNEESVIGEIYSARAEYSDTLLDIARKHGFGYADIKLMNPEIDTWLPGKGQEVILPGKFILPDVPRMGIVLNIPEMRLYYFPETKPGEEARVITYPLGVGREGWSTPYVKTKIVEKKKNPNWYPPESIRIEHEEAGDPLPKIVEAGPDNPLGDYAMRLGMREYLIHGTNKPYGIGMRVSHGCIRLYPEDIEALFQQVPIGTPVNIINEPYKIGVRDGVIYLEVHPHMVEDSEHFEENNMTDVVKYIVRITEERQYQIDWDMVREVVEDSRGIPVAVGLHTPESRKYAEAENKEFIPTKVKDSAKAGMHLRLETTLNPSSGQ